MSTPAKGIAIFVSDIHLSHKSPVFRSGEPNWYDAMARPLRQLSKYQKKTGLPIFCAGDVFDKYNPPPELINFAIRELPAMYAIPGQHDLTNHRMLDIKKSAYWTLVEAGKIVDMSDDVMEAYPRRGTIMDVYGYPWGSEPNTQKHINARGDSITIAVIHKYMWHQKSTKYPGADQSGNVSKAFKDWGCQFDLVVSGDNHIPFAWKYRNQVRMINCGSLMVRSSDQRDYNPSIWILDADREIHQMKVDITEDVMGCIAGRESDMEDYETQLMEVMKSLDSLDLIDDSILFDKVVNEIAYKVDAEKLVHAALRKILSEAKSE